MQHTKIEWVRNEDGSPGYSWNPIKGLCPEACFYCYARAMYRRFKKPAGLLLASGLIGKHGPPPSGSRIFACSTMELFHPAIPGGWRDWIFGEIESYPDLTFIILTKRPERIDRPMPDNVWLGVSITGAEDWKRLLDLSKVSARIKFVSLEPFLGDIPIISPVFKPDWVIVGRLTGYGKKRDPSTHAIQRMVDQAWFLRIPIFLKDNLKDIWGGPLIQEFPR